MSDYFKIKKELLLQKVEELRQNEWSNYNHGDFSSTAYNEGIDDVLFIMECK